MKGTSKGINASDYINFDTALNTGLRLLNDSKTEKIGLYIITSIYTGLRTGDVKHLRWEDFNENSFTVIEEKTRKVRTIQINDTLRKAIDKTRSGNGLIFISQKKTVYTTQALNRILKEVFRKESKTNNISTHSLRKTFGRRVYDSCNQSDYSLTLLSELFAHSSTQITRIYLGLKQEEFDNVYANL